MIEYDKIRYTELKKIVMDTNESGILPSNIRHVAVKGPKLYDEFIAAIEKLKPEQQGELPLDVINFYNYTKFEEEPEPEVPELDFGDDSIAVEPEEEPEEDEIDSGESAADDIEPLADEPIYEPEPTNEKEPEIEPELDIKPKNKVERKSKTPMTVTIIDGVLSVIFKELGVEKKFKLPATTDIPVFKPIRQKAMDFGKEHEATAGQLAAISKTLNIAGYYLR